MSEGQPDQGVDLDNSHGGCLCGRVRFNIRGALQPVSTCHCAMCRRSCTSVGAYTACAPTDLDTTGRSLKWYRSSPMARRGFCSACGTQLFWAPTHGRHVSISAGSLDDPSRLVWGEHIFVEGVRNDRPDEKATAEPGKRPRSGTRSAEPAPSRDRTV